MLDAVGEAIQHFASIELWLVILAGSIIGLIFGIIPGLSGAIAIALLMPFIFSMTAYQAFPLMLSILGSQLAGGSMTAILLNVPGTPVNAATLIDGFPMTQKGEASRAIGASLASALLGGVLAGFLALAMVPLILPLVMALRIGDMVFIILLGIATIGSLASGSVLKGLIAGGLGLLISFVGFDATTGLERFTFGSIYLYEGIGLIPVVLGLFAVPEMVELATKGGSISKIRVQVKTGDVLAGVREVVRHRWLALRSAVIGYIIGVIPGVGGTAAAFVSYAQAKQSSKHPEKFGTGIVEGVIASDASMDSEEGGAILTTLALGIPGTPPHALVLGAFLILGITPGPEMLTKHLDLSLTMISTLAIAHVIGVAICFMFAVRLASIALIPARILAPIIFALVFCGAFLSAQVASDIIVLLIVGMLGIILKRYGYSRPGLLVGFVLGNEFERYFFVSLKVSGPLFFLSPVSLSLILFIVASFAYRPLVKMLRRQRGIQKT